MKHKFDLFKLREIEQKSAKAGFVSECQCGCAYANCGGSSFTDNYGANYSHGYISIDFLPKC